MTVTEAVVRRIEELSRERGISLSEWSTLAGIAPATLDKLMKRKSGPPVETIVKLCKAIHIPLAKFYGADYIDTAETAKSSKIKNKDKVNGD